MSTRTKCYASALGGCSGRPSREHFVSKDLLKDFETREVLNLTGFPLNRTGDMALSAESVF